MEKNIVDRKETSKQMNFFNKCKRIQNKYKLIYHHSCNRKEISAPIQVRNYPTDEIVSCFIKRLCQEVYKGFEMPVEYRRNPHFHLPHFILDSRNINFLHNENRIPCTVHPMLLCCFICCKWNLRSNGSQTPSSSSSWSS